MTFYGVLNRSQYPLNVCEDVQCFLQNKCPSLVGEWINKSCGTFTQVNTILLGGKKEENHTFATA